MLRGVGVPALGGRGVYPRGSGVPALGGKERGGVCLKGRMGEVPALEKRGRGVSTGWAVLALGGRGVSKGGVLAAGGEGRAVPKWG